MYESVIKAIREALEYSWQIEVYIYEENGFNALEIITDPLNHETINFKHITDETTFKLEKLFTRAKFERVGGSRHYIVTTDTFGD